MTVMPSNDELKCAQPEPTSGFDNDLLSSSAEDMLSVSKVLFLFEFLDFCQNLPTN